jgi:periplasmic protein TonB
MQKAFFTLVLLIATISLKAQISNPVTITTEDSGKKIFTSVEQAPEFPGGLSEFYRFLGMNIRYPEIARKNKTQGRVIIQFIIERDGSVSTINVVRGVSKEIDEESVRVLKLSPKWNPGIQNSRPVRVSYTVPISFSLAK